MTPVSPSGHYATEHADARADVLAAGSAVTFTRTTNAAYDPLTNTRGTPVVTTVTGVAIETRGNPITYQALGLVLGEAPTLLFAPDTYGALPAVDAVVTWGGTDYRVKSVDPIAPDGVPILARVVVVR